MIIVREDPTSRLEDVIRKVHEEGDVARAEQVVGEERVEVGTRDDLKLAAGTVKVGEHRGSVDNFVVGQVDMLVPKLEWTPNRYGTPQFGILANPYPNRFGDPRSNMGSPF